MNQAQMMVLQVVKDQYDEQDLVELRQLLIGCRKYAHTNWAVGC